MSPEDDNMAAHRSRHRANADYSKLTSLFVEQNPLLTQWPTEEQRLMAVPMGWETLGELADGHDN